MDADFKITLPSWQATYNGAIENALRFHVLGITGATVMPFVHRVDPPWWLPSPTGKYDAFVLINTPTQQDALNVAMAITLHPINTFVSAGLPAQTTYSVTLAHTPGGGSSFASDTFLQNSESSDSSYVLVAQPNGNQAYVNVSAANFAQAVFSGTDQVYGPGIQLVG